MESIAYINAQYCTVYFHIFISLVCYTMSDPLTMTENMRFGHIHIRVFGTLIFDGWST